jgi:hypothetical protein
VSNPIQPRQDGSARCIGKHGWQRGEWEFWIEDIRHAIGERIFTAATGLPGDS